MFFDIIVGLGEIFTFMLIAKTFRKNATKKHILYAIIFALVVLCYTFCFLFVVYVTIISRSIKGLLICAILFLGYVAYGSEVVEKCKSNKKK